MIYQGGVPLKKLQGVPKTYKIPISTQCSFKIIYCRHHQRQTLQVHVNNCHEKMSTKNVMKIISQNISKSLLSNSCNRDWRHPCGRRNHRIRSEYLNTSPGVYMSVQNMYVQRDLCHNCARSWPTTSQDCGRDENEGQVVRIGPTH